MARKHRAHRPNGDAATGSERLSSQLRGIMRVRGITLSELSRETGISIGTLSRVVSGKRMPGFATIAAVARALDVDLDDLHI